MNISFGPLVFQSKLVGLKLKYICMYIYIYITYFSVMIVYITRACPGNISLQVKKEI